VLPAEAQAFIPNIIEGIHGAFSLATAQTFWLGVAGAIVATLAAIAIKEIPLRASNESPVPVAESSATAGTKPVTSVE
jgi:hypothetical protein